MRATKAARGAAKGTLRCITAMLVAVCLMQPVSAAGSLKVDSVKKETDQPYFNYHCSYPRLSGIQDNAVQQKINVIFKEKAESAMSLALYRSKMLDGKAQVTGQFAFEVRRNAGGMLSLVFREKLSAGSRQGILSQSGATVNTVSGKTYRLSELFKDHADYVGVVSEEVKRQIARRGLKQRQLQDFREIKINQQYYLTDDALVVFFGQSEYFPYDCGIQEFSIPLRSLDGILKPELRL